MKQAVPPLQAASTQDVQAHVRPGSGTALQRHVDESPRQLAQHEQLAKMQKSAPSSAHPNGLPSQLRAGIESLSGTDMGDVVVHRNSAKPAQLNAHAYAQGNAIHLGPGQEKHLPHEAWHVVQQKAGRVKATAQLAGAAINDNHDLEREADTMGQRAMQMHAYASAFPRKIDNKATNNAAVQRAMKKFPTRPEDDPVVARHKAAVEQIVDVVETQVDHARGLSLNWNALDFNDTGYIGVWASTARDYFNNPKQVPKFIHARFGYAIETFACANLPAQHAGLTINFQVSTGHTRPDIVLTHPADGVVGWLDITSFDSFGHILGKDGAGWRTKPFVYEIFYKPLALPEVLTGLEDPVYKAWGDYLSVKNEITYENEESQRIALRNQLLELQEGNQWETGYGNVLTKQGQTQSLLRGLGVDLGRNSRQAARGALAIADINAGPFGFTGVKTDRTRAKAFIKSKAAPEINAQHAAVEERYLEHYQDIIADHQNLPLIRAFYDYLSGDAPDKIEGGTAVAASVEEYDELKSVWEDLTERRDARATQLAQQMHALSGQLPQTVDFGVLQAWSNASVKLRNQARTLIEVLVEQQAFLDYLQQKYGPLSFFSRSVEETGIVQALGETPDDTTAALAARAYRESHPLPATVT